MTIKDDLLSAGVKPNAGLDDSYEIGPEGGVLRFNHNESAVDDWDFILNIHNLDPAKYMVVEPVKMRAWQSGGVWQYHYTCGIVPRSAARLPSEELKYFDKRVLAARKKVAEVPVGDTHLVAIWGDEQFGKADGDGLGGTIDRIVGYIGQVQDIQHEIKAAKLWTPSLGDIIENCDGHYAMQAFTAQANMREQMNLARRLLFQATSEWSKDFNEIEVPVVGGNHGEVRRLVGGDGKAFTDFGDNFDVLVWETIMDMLSVNPDAYGHVSFNLPHTELDKTFDLNGLRTTIVHGHQFGRKADQFSKAREWWKGQMEGWLPAMQSKLLINGHFHNFQAAELGERTWIQIPAKDGGSDWIRNSYGLNANPGMLVTSVTNGKWDRWVRILS